MSGHISVNPSAESIARAARSARKSGGLPPVQDWDPPLRGDLDMKILRDGTWLYLGTPITRPEMVRLFSTILRKDGVDYVLVTPVEKVRIKVEDVPFIAVDFDVTRSGKEQVLTFSTNVGDNVIAGPDNPIRIEERDASAAPYLRVRNALDARIDRKSFYRLVELGIHKAHEGQDWFGIMSAGAFFPLTPSSDV